MRLILQWWTSLEKLSVNSKKTCLEAFSLLVHVIQVRQIVLTDWPKWMLVCTCITLHCNQIDIEIRWEREIYIWRKLTFCSFTVQSGESISVYGYASYKGFLCVRACNCCLKASKFSPNNMLSLVKHYLGLLLPLKMASGETIRQSYECSPLLDIFLCVKNA